MRPLLLSGFFLFGLASFAQGQRIPLEVSFGIGGYFPQDGRYTHFFDHNPASFSGQAAYAWSVLDFKAGFERMRKTNNRGDESSQSTIFLTNFLYDSQKVSHTSTKLNSYVRVSTVRLGLAFHPFRKASFSPFIGFGVGITSTKGYGDSARAGYDSVYIDSFPPSPPDRVDTLPPAASSVGRFSKSVFGSYLEAGVHTRLPYNFFFAFEAVRDFRSKDKAGLIGPAKGGGTLLGMRLGYRF